MTKGKSIFLTEVIFNQKLYMILDILKCCRLQSSNLNATDIIEKLFTYVAIRRGKSN